MIDNDRQLLITLEYLSKWANSLEGMRLCAEETSPNFFSQGAAGPVAEIQKGLEEARRYLEHHLVSLSLSSSEHSMANGASHHETTILEPHPAHSG